MELTERDKWFCVSGTWLGVGYSFIAFTVTRAIIKTPFDNTDIIIGVVLGALLMGLGIYGIKKPKFV